MTFILIAFFFIHIILCHDNYYAYEIELLCDNVKSLEFFTILIIYNNSI